MSKPAAGEVRTRRWNDPAQPGEGVRLLICRYRPRGVRKEDETWDQWWCARPRAPTTAAVTARWYADGCST